MATKVILPFMGLTTVEATISSWLKQEGDTVTKGEALVEVLTDKAVNVIEAPEAGVVLKIVAPVDTVVPVTETICWIGQAGSRCLRKNSLRLLRYQRNLSLHRSRPSLPLRRQPERQSARRPLRPPNGSRANAGSILLW